MNTHPAPWEVSKRYGHGVAIYDANGLLVETVYDGTDDNPSDAAEIAQRICNAVNAAEEIAFTWEAEISRGHAFFANTELVPRMRELLTGFPSAGLWDDEEDEGTDDMGGVAHDADGAAEEAAAESAGAEGAGAPEEGSGAPE